MRMRRRYGGAADGPTTVLVKWLQMTEKAISERRQRGGAAVGRRGQCDEPPRQLHAVAVRFDVDTHIVQPAGSCHVAAAPPQR